MQNDYSTQRTQLLERLETERQRKIDELRAFGEEYRKKVGEEAPKIAALITQLEANDGLEARLKTQHAAFETLLQGIKTELEDADTKTWLRLTAFYATLEKQLTETLARKITTDNEKPAYREAPKTPVPAEENYQQKLDEEAAREAIEILRQERPVTEPTTFEYLTIEEIAKLPGSYPISTLQNNVLNAYKKQHETAPDKQMYFKLSGEIGDKRIYYAVREELLKAVLRNPEDWAEIKANPKEYIELTEKDAQAALERKITSSPQEGTWVTIDELVKLPNARSYAALRAAFEKTEKRAVRKPLPQGIHVKSYPVTEAKLTKELLEKIYSEKPAEYEALVIYLTPSAESIDGRISEDDLTDDTPKNHSIDTRVTGDASEGPAMPAPQPTYTEETTAPKKPSKRELKEQKEYEVGKRIMEKLIFGKKKVGGANTPLDNLPRNVEKSKRDLALREIEKWKKWDWLICQHVRTGFTKTSVNPQKLPEIKRHYSLPN